MLTDKEIDNFKDQLPEGVKIVDIREQSSSFDTWSFVEKYYPNYSSCNAVLHNNQLHAILDGGCGENEGASDLRQEIMDDLEIDADDDSNESYKSIMNEVKSRIEVSNAYIYQKAIEGFIEFMKGGQ